MAKPIPTKLQQALSRQLAEIEKQASAGGYDAGEIEQFKNDYLVQATKANGFNFTSLKEYEASGRDPEKATELRQDMAGLETLAEARQTVLDFAQRHGGIPDVASAGVGGLVLKPVQGVSRQEMLDLENAGQLLANQQAIANNPGGRISDKDFERAAMQFFRSGQTTETLTTSIDRTLRGTNRNISSKWTGFETPLDAVLTEPQKTSTEPVRGAVPVDPTEGEPGPGFGERLVRGAQDLIGREVEAVKGAVQDPRAAFGGILQQALRPAHRRSTDPEGATTTQGQIGEVVEDAVAAGGGAVLGRVLGGGVKTAGRLLGRGREAVKGGAKVASASDDAVKAARKAQEAQKLLARQLAAAEGRAEQAVRTAKGAAGKAKARSDLRALQEELRQVRETITAAEAPLRSTVEAAAARPAASTGRGGLAGALLGRTPLGGFVRGAAGINLIENVPAAAGRRIGRIFR